MFAPIYITAYTGLLISSNILNVVQVDYMLTNLVKFYSIQFTFTCI